ncbi:hypothetical protein ABZ464_04140 [Streptomyces sp. NPDC005820]|uniref:ATP-grasp domain-containing protein n=1 Tax=Streptomyces sp. NPDC005820 TaxID=3157069 RepID=UPI0033C259D2
MIIVPYAQGAASPSRIASATEPFGGVVFVVGAVPQSAAVLSVLEQFGPVVRNDPEDPELPARLEPFAPVGVVTFVDALLPLATRIGAHFGLRAHDASVCSLLTSKYLQRLRLNREGVGHVDTTAFTYEGELPASLAEAVYPAVLKPDCGASSRDTLFLDSHADLLAHTAELVTRQPYVLEEAIIGTGKSSVGDWLADYVSVENALVDGELICVGVSGKLPMAPPVRERGAVFPLTLDDATDAEVRDLSARAVRALGITTGLTHTEIKLTPEGAQVIEVNGRLGGAFEALMPQAGVTDPVALAVEIAAGAAPARVRELIRPAQKVTLVHWAQPPMTATAVETLTGMPELRRMDGVFAAGRVLAPGSSVDWRRGSIGRVVDIWLEAADLDELATRLAAAERHLDHHITWRNA